MTAFTGFLVETVGASVVLVSVGVAGTKLMVGKLLSRDLELHKMRLKEASDAELARLRADADREARKAAASAPPPPPAPTALAPSTPPAHDRLKMAGVLFQLFDDATLSIVRFALEFRAENHQAADDAGRAAIEASSRLSNFVRLNGRAFGKPARDSIEAVSAPLSELAWRSYRSFKDPALSEKETAQQIESLNKQTIALGRQIETLKAELAALLESESLP